MPLRRAVGENDEVTKGRLRDGIRRLLAPAGTLPPLSRRGQLFDVAVAVALLLAAVGVGADQRDDEQPPTMVPYVPDPWNPVPPVPPIPPGARPAPEPFLPIDQGHTG